MSIATTQDVVSGLSAMNNMLGATRDYIYARLYAMKKPCPMKITDIEDDEFRRLVTAYIKHVEPNLMAVAWYLYSIRPDRTYKDQ